METFSEDLRQGLCRSFDVRAEGEGRWVVRTPMLYDDGDALPVIVLRRGTEWSLTDDGMTVSHLFFDDFEFTEARFKRIKSVAESAGAAVTTEHRIDLPLTDIPTPYDIGDFLQVVAQVQGVARSSVIEREQTRYVTAVREAVISSLMSPDYDLNWSPPQLQSRKARYTADLRMPIDAPGVPDVVLFAASTADKANVSALTVSQFKRAHVVVQPVLAYLPDRVPSEAVYRFQDEVDDEGAAVEVHLGAYAEILPELRRRGVLV